MGRRGLKRKDAEREETPTEHVPLHLRPCRERNPAVHREQLINMTWSKLTRPSYTDNGLHLNLLMQRFLYRLNVSQFHVFPCSGLDINMQPSNPPPPPTPPPPPAPAVSLDPETENRLAVLPNDLSNLKLPSVDDDEDLSASDAIDLLMKDLQWSNSSMATPLYPGPDIQSLFYSGPETPPPPPPDDLLAMINSGSYMDTGPETSGCDDNTPDLINELIKVAEQTQALPDPLMDWDSFVPDVSPMPSCKTPCVSQPVTQEPPSTSSHSIFENSEILESCYLNGISLNDRFLDIDTSAFEKEAPGTTGGSCSTTTELPPMEDVWIEPYCSAPSPKRGKAGKIDSIMEALVGY